MIDEELESIAAFRRVNGSPDRERVKAPTKRVTNGVIERWCCKCKAWKLQTEFYATFDPRFPEIKPRYQSSCKECCKERGRKKR